LGAVFQALGERVSVASFLLSTSVVLMLATATAAGDRGRGIVPRLPARTDANPGTATLAPFTLFGWVSPPVDFTTPERYSEMAQAGLHTTVLAWEDPGTPEFNAARLQDSRPVGVRNLLLDLRLDIVHEDDPATFATLDSVTSAYRDDPAFLGYYLGDEPQPEIFPRLAEWFRLLRSRDPAHPGWNNLIGRVGFASHDAWLDYLRSYTSQVKPAVLCTDHYDHRASGDAGNFIENAAGTAQVAREYGLPFWGIVLLTQHRDFRYVDDALLRWQVAQWLSYGARGIGYFTYWTPAPDTNENWGDGMIRYGTGERSPHYEQVRTLNLRLAPLGEQLASLAWLSTEHSGGTPVGGTAFAPDSLVASVEGRAALGTFADEHGTPHLFVANRDSSAARTIALELVGERKVERFTDAGAWSPWPSTPTAHGRRVELPLEAGDFALLRVSGGCGGLSSGGCSATLDAAPNPGSVSVRFAATRVSGNATLMLLDLNGRRVWARALEGEAPVIVWDGRTDDGARAKPGFYWARLTDARGSVVRRVAWLGGR
jgi:hypothetical protein